MPDPRDIPRQPEAADIPESWPVRSRRVLARGRLFDYLSDEVETPSGETLQRDFIDHTGAVAVIAIDEEDNAVVVRQYRHPAGFRLIEPPAGLLDAEGEGFLDAARRELIEEAGIAADDWRILVDVFNSPGGLNESIRIYLARGLHSADVPEGFTVEGEEAHMDLLKVPVDDLVSGILAGRLQSPTLIAGVLAYAAARGNEDRLRPAGAPWPARTQLARLRAATDTDTDDDTDTDTDTD